MWAIAMSTAGQPPGQSPGQSPAKVENHFTIDHYRSLLSELRLGIAERARAQQEWSALDSGADGSSPHDFESARQALSEQFQISLAESQERHRLERQAADQQFQSETDSATAEFNEQTGQIERTAAAKLECVERKYQE